MVSGQDWGRGGNLMWGPGKHGHEPRQWHELSTNTVYIVSLYAALQRRQCSPGTEYNVATAGIIQVCCHHHHSRALRQCKGDQGHGTISYFTFSYIYIYNTMYLLRCGARSKGKYMLTRRSVVKWYTPFPLCIRRWNETKAAVRVVWYDVWMGRVPGKILSTT